MMAAVSVTLMELPSKQLLTIDLPSEEGGDMITMKEFMSLVSYKLPINLSLWYLMVGNRRIRNRDADRPVLFFLLDGSPWFAYILDTTNQYTTKSLVIRTLTMKEFSVLAPATAPVSEIKILIEEHEGIPPDQQRLLFGANQLEDCMSVVSIPNEATLALVFCLRGGGSGVHFADVMDSDGPKVHRWSHKAPDWRRASIGLCLEGKCTNKRCRAFGHMVVMSKGYTEFDLINDAHLCECPICHCNVVPITCGFNNCQWKIIARKIEPGKPPQMFKTDWKFTGDFYERFSPEKSGTANFLDLKILCRESQQSIETCTACGFTGDKISMRRASCGHSFHAERCFLVGGDKNCIECLAHRSLTNYQQLFQ